jgi:5-methylcytosine-specific restriction protein A
MISKDANGIKYKKVDYYRELAKEFERSETYYERRMHNISFVLQNTYEIPYLSGLKPLFGVGAGIQSQIEDIIDKNDYLHNEDLFNPTADRKSLKKKINYILKKKNINLNPPGNKKPKKKKTQTTQYERCPKVVAAILSIANGKCENCKENAPFVSRKDNSPYLEVHHIKRLADNGSDTTTNAVAVCPNCHKALHYSNKSEELANNLINTIDRLIKE